MTETLSAERDSHSPDDHVSERIIAPLCFIIFFSVLNGVMFNVAIPDIAAEYRLLPSEVSWVMTGYILIFGLGSLVYGRLSDQVPVRRLITTGLLLLNSGSLLGLVSTWYPMLIAARLVQAGGGAAIPALAMLVATRYMPEGVKGKVLGMIASTVALAAGVGPILGGFVAGTFHWRYLFLIILSTALAIPSLRRHLPDERGRKSLFDIRGTLLLGSSLACLLFSLSAGLWWFVPPGLAAAILLFVHLRGAGNPLVPPDLLTCRAFRNTAVSTALAIGSVFGMMFMTPMMLREANGLGAGSIGLALFPGAMTAAILGTVGGRLNDRRGSGFVGTIGMCLAIAGHLLLSTFAGQPPPVIAAALLVIYAGFSFLQSSLPHTASSSLPTHLTGVGMGTYNLIFFMSGAFSAALVGRLLDIRLDGYCLNPLTASVSGWPYSNIFVLLAAATGGALLLYRRTFRRNAIGGPPTAKPFAVR